MVEITTNRHGQAQTAARDEASYDSLSRLGHSQARWLGRHLDHSGWRFDRIVTGTLSRQRQTAAEIGIALGIVPQEDKRLNEMNYFVLSRWLEESHALPIPTDR